MNRTGADVPCRVCGKVVYRYPSTMNRTLCSHACRDAAKKAERVNEETGEAKCARCREWKPVADFVRGTKMRPHSYCKTCSSEWFHEQRGTPVEQRKSYRPAFLLTPEEKAAKKREANQRQHSARRAAGKAPTRVAIEAMWCAQHGRCAYCACHLDAYHIDHKTPISRGGGNEIENLQLTCGRCNMRKGAMTHEEFLACKRRPVVDWQ